MEDEEFPGVLNERISREAVKILYTARLFWPGLLRRQALLIVYLILPIIDFVSDYINAEMD